MKGDKMHPVRGTEQHMTAEEIKESIEAIKERNPSKAKGLNTLRIEAHCNGVSVVKLSHGSKLQLVYGRQIGVVDVIADKLFTYCHGLRECTVETASAAIQAFKRAASKADAELVEQEKIQIINGDKAQKLIDNVRQGFPGAEWQKSCGDGVINIRNKWALRFTAEGIYLEGESVTLAQAQAVYAVLKG